MSVATSLLLCALASFQDLSHALSDQRLGTAFDLECTITQHWIKNDDFLAFEGKDRIMFRNRSRLPTEQLRLGDRIHVAGEIVRFAGPDSPGIMPACTSIVRLARGKIPVPKRYTAKELLNRPLGGELVELTGTITDACVDDIHARFATLILSCQGLNIYLALERQENKSFDFSRYLGARVSVIGTHSFASGSLRQTMKNVVTLDSLDSISILRPPSPEMDAAKDVDDFQFISNDKFSTGGERYCASGQVIATWGSDNLLIRRTSGSIVKGELSLPNLPKCGDRIRLIGFPETDLYIPILTRAHWESEPGPVREQAAAIEVTTKRMQSDDFDTRQFNFRYNGKAVRMRGIIRSLPLDESDGVLFLENDGQMVKVDASSVPDALEGLGVGFTVKVSGTCVMDTEKMSFNRVFPRINGYRIVLRSANDIQTLSTPPWWTTGRLFAAIGTLLAILVTIFVWNIALRRVAARKGRELFKEQLGHVKADLRTEERTRLAVELHDTLAQNLTGVSMEIEAANDLRGDAPKPMLDHLGIAAKALKSCRDELRNCLWDLRSQALEEPDMTKAVLKTLQPVVNDSRLAVRFNVPRARLSDNTAHALLRVIRELVVNAIRHGAATSVKVAGTIDGERLLCSVTDDGCGFDPDSAPGVLQGHFGLQGIQERIDELGGTFEIASTPGKGTKATISVAIPHEH